MKLYVLIDETGYIYSSSSKANISTRDGKTNCIAVEVPDDFDVLKQREYRLVDGKLVHDPLPEAEPTPDPIQQRMDEQEAALIELAALIAGGDI